MRPLDYIAAEAAKPKQKALPQMGPARDVHREILDQLSQAPANRFTPMVGHEQARYKAQDVVDAAPNPEVWSNKSNEWTDRAVAEKAVVQDQQRTTRVQAINADHPSTLKIKDRIDRMTQADYDKLGDLQRAAVDFNTGLVRAVRRDNRQQDTYRPTPAERTAYDKALGDIFTGGVASADTYAPETVALLKQIGYSDPAASLDDFLGLKAAIKAKDLKGLTPIGQTSGGTPNPEQDRDRLLFGLAERSRELEEKLANGTKLLKTMTATTVVDRNADVTALGGEAKAPDVGAALGYGNRQIDSYFAQAFELLANEKGTLKGAVSALEATAPGTTQDFLKYAAARSSDDLRYSAGLSNTGGAQYRTPEEFRKLLGLEGGGTNGGQRQNSGSTEAPPETPKHRQQQQQQHHGLQYSAL